MAQNPVTAFLAGFQAVDNLETNRQQRRFREQQMSQAKKDWAFRNDQYQRQRWAWRQESHLKAAEALTPIIMKEVSDQIEATYQAQIDAGVDPKKAAKNREEHLNRWMGNSYVDANGNPSGATLFLTELLNRMIAQDPSIGEALALSHGYDPGAGPLVNSDRPMSAVYGVPPEHNKGRAGFAMQVNTIDGRVAPYTKNRTANPNDPIEIANISTQGLVNFFGGAYFTNESQLLMSLRAMMGDEEPAAQVTREKAQERSTTEPEEEAAPGPPAPEDDLMLPHIEDTSELEARPRPETIIESGHALQGTPESAVTYDTNEIRKQAEEAPSGLERFFDWLGRGAVNNPRAKLAEQRAKAFASEADGLDINTPEVRAPADSAKAVPANQRKNATLANVQTNTEAAIEAADTPSPDALAPTAERVLQAQGKRPTLHQLYNALLMAKAEIVTPQELRQYAKTGSFDIPAARKLQWVQKGIYGRWVDASTGQIGPLQQVFPDDGAANGMSSRELMEEQEALLEGFPEFQKEGGPNLRETLATINTADNLLTNAGLLRNEDRISQEYINSIRRGARNVANFEDPRGFMEDTALFSDPELGPNNEAIGFILDQLGVAGEDVNWALYQYGIEMRNLRPYWSGETLLRNVIKVEEEARRLVANSKGKLSRREARDILIRKAAGAKVKVKVN